jgi:gamma-glutamyl-gamma-aminobutyrate hydrolase PuuD
VNKKVLVVYRDIADAQPYARAIEAAGATPVLEEARPGIEIGSCAGLLLTGGSDVDPALYGESANPETQPPDPDRDAAEAAVIDEALARDLPLLAICRGMQILNVHLGGSLVQHLPGAERHVRRTPDRSLPATGDRPGTLLSGIAQRRRGWQTAAHQAVPPPADAVAKPGPGMAASSNSRVRSGGPMDLKIKPR